MTPERRAQLEAAGFVKAGGVVPCRRAEHIPERPAAVLKPYRPPTPPTPSIAELRAREQPKRRAERSLTKEELRKEVLDGIAAARRETERQRAAVEAQAPGEREGQLQQAPAGGIPKVRQKPGPKPRPRLTRAEAKAVRHKYVPQAETRSAKTRLCRMPLCNRLARYLGPGQGYGETCEECFGPKR